MTEQVYLLSINAIPSAILCLVSSFMTSADQISGQPSKMILDVAIDRDKALSDNCQMSIFLLADYNFHSSDHYKMLSAFASGEMFVPVEFHGLKIFRKKENGLYKYFGVADSFTVTTKDRIDF